MRRFFFVLLLASLVLLPAVAVHASLLEGLKNTGSRAYDTTGTLLGESVTTSEPRSPLIILALVINALLVVSGIVLLVLVVIAGFKWVLAAGNPDTIKEARRAIVHASIGLLIILSAFSFTYFLTRQFEAASRGPQYQPGTNVELPQDVQLKFQPF